MGRLIRIETNWTPKCLNQFFRSLLKACDQASFMLFTQILLR